VSEGAAALRLAFDRAFAVAPPPHHEGALDFLAIRVGASPFAVRLTEISRVAADCRIIWVPSHVSELRGIVGLQRTILPAYDLAAMLGLVKASAPRWLMVARQEAIALAFDAVDGCWRATPDALAAITGDAAGSGHTREILRISTPRPVIDVRSIVDAVKGLEAVAARS
jgi:chemotaxis signal transduction protein